MKFKSHHLCVTDENKVEAVLFKLKRNKSFQSWVIERFYRKHTKIVEECEGGIQVFRRMVNVAKVVK